MSDLHLFCTRLSEAQTDELDSIRNSYRKDNTSIPLAQLISDTRQYFEKHLSDANKRNLGEKIFDNYPHTSKLTPEYIAAFADEINMNIIRRNPRTTLIIAALTAAISFIGVLIGVFIFEVVSQTAFLTLLPFLTGLGPVGAALAVAAIITLGAMSIYSLVVGITAAATNKNIKVEASFSFGTGQMDSLHTAHGHSSTHEAHAKREPATHPPHLQHGSQTPPAGLRTKDLHEAFPKEGTNPQTTYH